MQEHILYAMKRPQAGSLFGFHRECIGWKRLKDNRIYTFWLVAFYL